MSFRKVSLVAALSVAWGAASADATPVMDPASGHWYELFLYGPTESHDWAAANASANAKSYLGLSGHLVTITSAAENAFVHSAVINPPGVAGPGEVWAGGYQTPTQADPIKDWFWVNGEGGLPGTNGGPGYANWAGGEPNDFYDSVPSRDNSEMFLGINWGSQQWNDEGALGNINGYVVEYQGVPEGGSLVGVFGASLAGLALTHRRMRKG